MSMKKIVIVMGTVMTMAAGSAYAGSTTTVSGGTVHFHGSLIDAACSVSADSADQVVELGQYTLHHFKAVGAKTNLIPFKIKLEDCDTSVASTAAVAFTGQQDVTNAALLAVSSAGNTDAGATASGVGIQILDEASKAVKPDGSVFSSAHKLIDGENILNFSAQYVSTADKPTAGQADADATFIMQYQ
ncbi:type 1 fimbrial protein subunit FimA [Enterobacteriaceae bacterium ML5]|nr:type 1 fimbrial protein subunit FimA [Enterobacteriaceae bacterium ML5]